MRREISVCAAALASLAACAEPSAADCIHIEAGAFVQGCDPARDPACNANELPARSVTVSAYSIDRTEVTRAAYAECVEAGDCAEPSCDWDPVHSPDRPVVCVSRDAAATYCASAGKLAVVRDGHYLMPEPMMRVTMRGGTDPTTEFSGLGFRCAW